jgi:glycosyltransferase involved in cell wall biosynthesis
MDIIIPARNEAKTIGNVVRAAVQARLGQVIVVNDQSTDQTAQAAADAGAVVVQGPGKGKGEAISTGLRHVKSDRVMMLDGDLTGLTAGHVRQLSQGNGMIAGVPLGPGRVSPGLLTGERTLPTRIARSVPLTGWAAETQLNQVVRNAGLPVTRIPLHGVTSAPRSGPFRILTVIRDSFHVNAKPAPGEK